MSWILVDSIHARLSRAKFHFRDCGSLGRWPQGGMRPVKMVLRPQVCVCVCDRKPGCPRGNSAAQFCNRHCKKWSKEAIFLKKWLNKAFQDTVGRIMSPRGWQKWVTSLNNALCSWGHPSGQPQPIAPPAKPKGKSAILCSIEPWMLSAYIRHVYTYLCYIIHGTHAYVA